MEETILTPEQVAQILQMHPFTVLKFIKQGRLKASKLGRVYRIRRSDVDAFLDEQAKDSEAAMEKRRKGKIGEQVTADFETRQLQEEKSTTMQITPPEPREETEGVKNNGFDHYIIEFKTET